MLKTHLEQLASTGHLNKYIDTSLYGKRDPNTTEQRPKNPGIASAGIIHVIHNPLCSSIIPSSYRSELQKATSIFCN